MINGPDLQVTPAHMCDACRKSRFQLCVGTLRSALVTGSLNARRGQSRLALVAVGTGLGPLPHCPDFPSPILIQGLIPSSASLESRWEGHVQWDCGRTCLSGTPPESHEISYRL